MIPIRITPRSIARQAGQSVYFGGKPCPKGHTSGRYINGSACVKCLAEKNAHIRTTRGPYKSNPISTRVFRYKEPEREAARFVGELLYFTGRACSYGHTDHRKVSNRECVQCLRDNQRRHYNKDIEKSREYQRDFAQRWRAENDDKFKGILLRSKLKKYGLTPETFLATIVAQNGKCATCPRVLKNDRFTHVDHCHKTGKVRGVLCHSCNIALGIVQENSNVLRSLATYLERHKEREAA